MFNYIRNQNMEFLKNSPGNTRRQPQSLKGSKLSLTINGKNVLIEKEMRLKGRY